MSESIGEGPKQQSGKQEEKENIKVSGASESLASERHPNTNEDTVLVDLEQKLFGIFDGMGGHSAGEVASRLACEAIKDYVQANINLINSNLSAERVLRDSFTAATLAIKKDVAENRQRNDMGSTATVVKFFTDADGKNFAVVANIGDSRAYILKKTMKLEQISEDDDMLGGSSLSKEDKKNIAANLARASKPSDLTATEQGFFDDRNILVKALTANRSDAPNIYFVPINIGDKVILTTDGVHDNLATDEIEEITSSDVSIQKIATDLAEKAKIRSRGRGVEMRAKPDDMSAIVIEIQ